MLWDPGSIEKDGKKELDVAPVSPILVPMQDSPTSAETNIPLLVPDVQDLKDQFQLQQNMLTQIKETLKQNESQLSSKEKQVEVYANKLSQIRARSKNTKGKKAIAKVNPDNLSSTLTKTSPNENIDKTESLEHNSKSERRGKISELKKCLEENKIKFEQRTGKEQSETKKIESLVEQLKMQLIERDKTIQDLQKDIEASTIKTDTLSKNNKKKLEFVNSKTTQTNTNEEVIALQNKIYELETRLLDLQENVKEKESVIEARTQAVTLLSQDFSLKEKNTWDNLEETRQEMRAMQTKFVAIEDQLKKDLVDQENKLIQLNEKNNKLESINFELSLKNAELQEKIVNLQKNYAEVEAERSLLKESMGEGRMDERLEELMKKINVLTKELDDRNKSMIKMKLEHKNKIKHLNKVLETLKETSNEKAEIVKLNNTIEEFDNIKTKLENRVAELEDEKGNLLLSVLDVDDMKVAEGKFRDQIKDLENIIQNQSEDLTLHLHTISKLEKEKLDLAQANQDQVIVIENLYAKIQNLESNAAKVDIDENFKIAEQNQKLQDAEMEYNKKLEILKGEHRKEIEMLESFYNSKIETIDRKELDEYRILTEINNIHVEEQIELLIREKQQLLEKLKSLSGVSSTDSLTFEKMEHSDLKEGDKETIPVLGEEVDVAIEKDEGNRISHLQRIINDQQYLINDLQKTIDEEKQKTKVYQNKLDEMEGTIKLLENVNAAFKKQFDTAEILEPGHNQKSNLNAKNRIKKIEMELTEAKITIDQQNEKLKDLNLKLEEKESLIKKYTEKIELFEKDDWDRQNHWKNVGDDIEDVQELQKKCLSLENSLIELNEDCERLRKENIEVVHRLSVEKVKRKKLLEEIRTKSQSNNAETPQKSDDEAMIIEEKLNIFIQHIADLEEKMTKLEFLYSKPPEVVDFEGNEEEKWEKAELLQKIEWSNVVLSGKETEIFELQNLLENRNKMMEDLQMDLKQWKENFIEKEKTLNQLNEKLKAKEIELEELSYNFNKLQEYVETAKQKTVAYESQVQNLLVSLKDMENNVFVKESELQQIKATLAEKNSEIASLKTSLENVNSDLSHSYQDQLENMKKCLKNKELQHDTLLAEKERLIDLNKSLEIEKDEIFMQKINLTNDKDQLQHMLKEKETEIAELNLKIKENSTATGQDKNQELEDMKVKMKKLAANLKKKAQNEKDLLQQVKELETYISEKEKIAEKLQADVNEITEKWTSEKSEKEQIRSDMAALEEDSAGLKNQLLSMENEIKNNSLMHEGQVKLLEDEIQKAYETCNRLQMCEQQYKDTIVSLEAQVQDMTKFQNENQKQIEEERKTNEKLLKNLADISGKYEKIKFDFDQIHLEKLDLMKKCEELENLSQNSVLQNSGFDAKLQESFAVIENLEAELRKAQDYVKTVEEKLFTSEERRIFLENKNEEMCKKIMEDSQNSVTIDDLYHRVDELLKSEKSMQRFAKSLENENLELKQTLDEIQSEKIFLEKEVKILTERINEVGEELHHLKDSDLEKSQIINNLTQEVEKEKSEQKHILRDFEKLNKDYEQFESDYKESLEKSQNLEKSLRHKIEELTNENSLLRENVSLLSEDKYDGTDKVEKAKEQDQKPKKRKSVTFKSDDVEYIKDLKSELCRYDENLKLANEQIEALKEELFREKLKSEVTSVVKEAQEKVENLIVGPKIELSPVKEAEITKIETGSLEAEKPIEEEERQFNANVFFGSEEPLVDNELFGEIVKSSQEFDQTLWEDDSWGIYGQLEEKYFSEKSSNYGAKLENVQEKVPDELQIEIDQLKNEVETLSKKLQEQENKYTKAVKKLKEQKIICDKMESDMKNLNKTSGFGDLDAAIIDELKSQIQNMEAKEKELLNTLEHHNLEKENLLKRIDVLSAGNEKFLEMKERQDNEVEIWQRKNNELLKEIAELRQEITKSAVLPEGAGDDDALLQENKELKNKIEALEWKNCELTELLEEKQELLEGKENESSDVDKVIQEKSILQKEIEELNNVKELLEKKLFDEEKKNSTTIDDLNEQLSALASENETLQEILNKMKKSSEEAKQENKSISKIFDYFKSSAPVDFLPAPVVPEKTSLTTTSSQTQLSSPTDNITNENFEEKLFEKDILELQGDLLGEVNQETEKMIQLETMMDDELVITSEIDELERKRASFEDYIKFYNEMFIHTKNLNSGKRKAVEDMKEKLLGIQSENKSILSEKIVQIENFMSLREEKLRMLQRKYENLIQIIKMKINQKEKGSQMKMEEFSHFETIDLNQKTDPLFVSDNEIDILKDKLFEIEEILKLKEEELQQMQLTFQQNVETEKQKVLELENSLGLNKEKLKSMDEFLAQSHKESDELTKRIQELEETLLFKENEFLQDQSLNLKKLQELEEENNHKSQMIQNMNVDFNATLLQLQEESRYKEGEIQKLIQEKNELENILSAKDKEITQLANKLNDLEKSYNDSKIEIERLLNEEKLNTEEKFVEPFQKNIQIPVPFELEALTRTLTEEKQKVENLQYELMEKNKALQHKTEKVQVLSSKIFQLESRLQELVDEEERQKMEAYEAFQVKAHLEKMVTDLQMELQNANHQLSNKNKELEKMNLRTVNEETLSNLKSQLIELETELCERSEKKDVEIEELKAELQEKVNFYDTFIATKRDDEAKMEEKIDDLEKMKKELYQEVEFLKSEIKNKENEISSLSQVLNNERAQMVQMTAVLQEKENEVIDLKETLTHLQNEISHFRNFEKQVKELRVAHLQEAGSEMPITDEGEPDLSDWTEHELAELSTRLQSDLDTALYMLHQRDVRCDELTFELMQLLEERDTLQLRLSTALRINEELRSMRVVDNNISNTSLKENKDLVDQSNDRQKENNRVPSEDLQQLASKISELHSVSYLRDKTIKDDSLQRHSDQMNLLSRISDSDISLSRSSQSSPTVLLNWVRGKTTPKVMHI